MPDTSTALGLRDRALMEVLYSTGIRRSEIANLDIHDINPSQGVLTVVQGKGKRDRVLPIGQRALAWVDQYVIDARPALVDRFHVVEPPNFSNRSHRSVSDVRFN